MASRMLLTCCISCFHHSDQTFPIDGAIIPGGGSMIGLIECATSQYVR